MYYQLREDDQYYAVNYYTELGKEAPSLAPMVPRGRLILSRHTSRWHKYANPAFNITMEGSAAFGSSRMVDPWKKTTKEGIKSTLMKSNQWFEKFLSPYLAGPLLKKGKLYYCAENDMMFDLFTKRYYVNLTFAKSFEAKTSRRVKLHGLNSGTERVHTTGTSIPPEDFIKLIQNRNTQTIQGTFDEDFPLFIAVDHEGIKAVNERRLHEESI